MLARLKNSQASGWRAICIFDLLIQFSQKISLLESIKYLIQASIQFPMFSPFKYPRLILCKSHLTLLFRWPSNFWASDFPKPFIPRWIDKKMRLKGFINLVSMTVLDSTFPFEAILRDCCLYLFSLRSHFSLGHRLKVNKKGYKDFEGKFFFTNRVAG